MNLELLRALAILILCGAVIFLSLNCYETKCWVLKVQSELNDHEDRIQNAEKWEQYWHDKEK